MSNAAFVTGFRYDVFISYAWVNNYALEKNKPETGWISRFKALLQQRIDEKLGRIGAAKLYFDRTQLKKNEDFNPQIEDAVRNSAVFVAMFSDGYIQSSSCCQEIVTFNKAVGGDVAQSGFLFFVPIDHVGKDSKPEEFRRYSRNIIGYDFYRHDPDNNNPTRLDEDDDEFQKQLNDLRTKLANKLKEMQERNESNEQMQRQSRAHGVAPTVAGPKPRTTVLVAQSTDDLRKPREQLIRYCESSKLNVLGEAPYPKAADAFRKAFLESLKHAHLFVQLLSEGYLSWSNDFPHGIERWQLEEARRARVSILQWRHDSLDRSQIENDLHRELVFHPDVTTDPPATLHQEVVDRAGRACEVGKVQAEQRLVLVKYSDRDKEPTLRMVESLKVVNVSSRPTLNGRSLLEWLREIPFDALIVVLGNCPDNKWLDKRGDEMLEVQLNFNDQAPLRAYYICGVDDVVPPFVGQDVLEIHGPSELDRLVQAIQVNGDGR